MRAFRFFLYGIILLILAGTTGCHNKNGQQGTDSYQAGDTDAIRSLIDTVSKLSLIYPDSAKDMWNNALSVSQKSHYERGVTFSLMGLGKYYFDKGLYDSALIFFQQGLKTGTHQGIDKTTEQQLYNNIAASHIRLNNYKKALPILLKIAATAEHEKRYDLLPPVYINIGVVMMNMDERNKALYYIEKGEAAALKTIQPQTYLAPLYVNEAQALLYMGNIKAGKEKCQMAIDLLKHDPNPECEAQARFLLGNIYEQEGATNKAIDAYEAIINRKEDLPNNKLLAAARLGRIHTENNDYTQAETFYNYTLQLAQKLNSPLNQAGAYYDLSVVYKKQGNTAKALAYVEQYMKLNDSVRGEEKIKALSQMEVKYSIAEKDKEIAENKLMIANQQAGLLRKNVLLGTISAGTLIIICGFFFFYRNRQRSQLQQAQLALLRATTDGEEKERNRISRELHDGIGGQLSLLKSYLGIMENRLPEMKALDLYQEATDLLDNTVNDIRKTAHNLMPELLLKHGLSEATRIYCEQVQINEGFNINYQHYGFIDGPDKRFELSVYRIVQELVHNVIKHAQASFALVQLSQYNEILDVTVEDNGIGMQQLVSAASGMGLESIRQRVEELQGKMNISSSPEHGTTVYIEFNLKSLKK